MSYYFWLFVGSLIEFLSIRFLLQLVSTDYTRVRGRQLIVVLIVSTAILVTESFPVLVGYAVNYGLFILLLSTTIKREMVAVATEFCLALTAGGIIEFLIIVGIKWTGFAPVIASSAGALRMLIPLLLLSVLLGCNRKLKLVGNSIYDRYCEEIRLFSVNIFLFYQIEIYMWDVETTLWHQNTHIILIALLCWIGVNGVLLKKIIDNRRQKELIRLHDQMDMTNSIFDHLKSEQHEFNRHLQYISGCIAMSTPVEAVKKISEYLEDLNSKNEVNKEIEKESVRIFTCSDDLNALLYDEQKKWQKEGVIIYCTADREFDFPLHRFEFIEVVGNLVSNGCEHAANLPNDKRYVILEIGMFEGQKCIAVKNVMGEMYTNVNPVDFSKKGFSTKSSTGRGYGLYNVKQITTRYGGKLEAAIEGDCLCMRVLLP